MAEPRCKQVFAMLSQYLDGELSARNCRELERHLKDCKPCLAYIDTLKATVRVCRQHRVQSAPRPSPRVRKALLESVRKSRSG